MDASAARFRFAYRKITIAILPAVILAGTSLVAGGEAQTPAATAKSVPHASRYRPDPFPKRAAMYYGPVWGVDSLSVRAVESGELIRFTYRVIDPEKATIFNDKKIDAFLDSPKENMRLVIPTMEKVGQLRQATTPEAGHSYWMAFSNPRRTVKRGDRVTVVIGRFHAENLLVE